MRIIAEASDRQEAARRIAAIGPLGGRLASGAERRRVVAAQLPVHEWPRQRLMMAAVDAESGRRVTFGAGSGAGLIDAVMASGALPGIHPLVAINGRRYADGGVHSLYSADLAAGHDVVTVFSPMPLNDYLQATLAAEIKALGPATVHVVLAYKQSLATIGPDALSATVARAAAEAGIAQARQEITALQAIWPSQTPGRLTSARPRQPLRPVSP
jgi:NTE family protein